MFKFKTVYPNKNLKVLLVYLLIDVIIMVLYSYYNYGLQ